MKVFDEMDFNDILRTAWRGAVDTAERIEREGKGDEFCDMLEELYPEGISRVELNDLMWFDSDWIFETLGISKLMKYRINWMTWKTMNKSSWSSISSTNKMT